MRVIALGDIRIVVNGTPRPARESAYHDEQRNATASRPIARCQSRY
jgi:hypothetical protein